MMRWLRKRWRRYRYTVYLRSPAWRRKRAQVLKRDGYRCRHCPETQGLECHHLTYTRFGHERLSDLLTLCHSRHRAVHRQQRRHTWATKSA